MNYSPELADQYANRREQFNETDAVFVKELEIIGVKDKAVLDLGCGDGRHARLIKEMGASHVVGVDVNERMVELAKSKTGESDGVSFAVADGRDIPVEDNSTDIVFSNFVIHYFANAGEIFNPKYSPPACSGGSNW